MTGSRCDILDNGFGLHALTEVGTEPLQGVEIDLAPKEIRQLLLHAEERETRNVVRIELDQHVDVTVRAEVVAQDRPEQRELTDVVATAEVRDLVLGNIHSVELHAVASSTPF